MTRPTGMECGGFDDTPERSFTLQDQMIGRVLRVSQSAPQPQVEFVDLVDVPDVQIDFGFLGALGTSEGMITGSAPQQLIEEMPQQPQGGIN